MFEGFRSLRKFSMQHLTKDILTTKITKATKGSDIFDYKLRAPSLRLFVSFVVKFAFLLYPFFGCGSAAPGSRWLNTYVSA